jgi:hypothetical protein
VKGTGDGVGRHCGTWVKHLEVAADREKAEASCCRRGARWRFVWPPARWGSLEEEPIVERGAEQGAHAREKSHERQGKTDLATARIHGWRWIGVTQRKWAVHVGWHIPWVARLGWWMVVSAGGYGLDGAVGFLVGHALEWLPGGGGPQGGLEWWPSTAALGQAHSTVEISFPIFSK